MRETMKQTPSKTSSRSFLTTATASSSHVHAAGSASGAVTGSEGLFSVSTPQLSNQPPSQLIWSPSFETPTTVVHAHHLAHSLGPDPPSTTASRISLDHLPSALPPQLSLSSSSHIPTYTHLLPTTPCYRQSVINTLTCATPSRLPSNLKQLNHHLPAPIRLDPSSNSTTLKFPSNYIAASSPPDPLCDPDHQYNCLQSPIMVVGSLPSSDPSCSNDPPTATPLCSSNSSSSIAATPSKRKRDRTSLHETDHIPPLSPVLAHALNMPSCQKTAKCILVPSSYSPLTDLEDVSDHDLYTRQSSPPLARSKRSNHSTASPTIFSPQIFDCMTEPLQLFELPDDTSTVGKGPCSEPNGSPVLSVPKLGSLNKNSCDFHHSPSSHPQSESFLDSQSSLTVLHNVILSSHTLDSPPDIVRLQIEPVAGLIPPVVDFDDTPTHFDNDILLASTGSSLMDDFGCSLLNSAQGTTDSFQILAEDKTDAINSSTEVDMTDPINPTKNEISHKMTIPDSMICEYASSACGINHYENFQGFKTALGRPLPLPSKKMAANLLANLESTPPPNKAFQTKVIPVLRMDPDLRSDAVETIIEIMSQTSSECDQTSHALSIANTEFKPVFSRNRSAEYMNQKARHLPPVGDPSKRTAAYVKQLQLDLAADLYGTQPFAPSQLPPMGYKQNSEVPAIQPIMNIQFTGAANDLVSHENLPPIMTSPGSPCFSKVHPPSFKVPTTNYPAASRGFTTPFKKHIPPALKTENAPSPLLGTKPATYKSRHLPNSFQAPASGASTLISPRETVFKNESLATPNKTGVAIARTPCPATFRTPFKKKTISSNLPISHIGAANRTSHPSNTPLERPIKTSAAVLRHTISSPKLFNLAWEPQVCRTPRITLRDLEAQDLHTYEMDSVSAMQYQFPDSEWGAAQAYTALLLSGGNAKLVSPRWVRNHYRWIIWKLFSYTQKFGHYTVSVPKFTRDSVMRQLRYRYEREFVCAHRSCLQHVLERDDVAGRPMVLVVSRIVEPKPNSSEEAKLELTDGWYSVPAVADSVLTRAVYRGRITVGMKLVVSMAVMMGNLEGVPAIEIAPDWPTGDPVHVFDPIIRPDVYLKITGNAVKPAQWDARLGFISGGKQTLPLALRALSVSGGAFSDIAFQVLRVYPMLHVETYPSGEKAYRNDWEECRAQQQFDAMMTHGEGSIFGHKEVDYSAVRCSDQVSDDALTRIVLFDKWDKVDAKLPARVANELKERAAAISEASLRNARDKMQRHVVPFLRIRVACARQMYREVDGEPVPPTTALITIWRPDDSVLQAILEGRLFQVTHGRVNGTQNGVLTLSTTGQSRWNPYVPTHREGRGGRALSLYQPRVTLADFSQLGEYVTSVSSDTSTEVDLQGILVNTHQPHGHACELFVMDKCRKFVLIKLGRNGRTLNDAIKPGRMLRFRNLKFTGMDSQWRMPTLHSGDATEMIKVARDCSPALLAEGRGMLDDLKLSNLDWGAFFSQDRPSDM